MVNSNNPNEILGFYSILAYTLNGDIKGYPNEIPCILLGRLAVSKTMQGKRLAFALMANLFSHVKKLSQEVGIAFIATHAKNHDVIGFYSRFGFIQDTPDSLTMIIKADDL